MIFFNVKEGSCITVKHQTPNREVLGLNSAGVLCFVLKPDTFLVNTQEAMAP